MSLSNYGLRRNHEHIPARRLAELKGQYMAEKTANVDVSNLVWLRKIERKQTTDAYPLWFLHGEKVFHVSSFDTFTLDQFRAAGLDLTHTLLFEILAVEILVEWGYTKVRRGSLDAQRPAIVRVVKVQSAATSLFDQVGALMADYGYHTDSDMANNPGWVVDRAVGSIFPYRDQPELLLDKVRLWLEKWRTAHPTPVSPVVSDAEILAQLRAAGDALDSWRIERPEQLLLPASIALPSDTDWCAALPNNIPSRRTAPAIIHLPPPTIPLLPAYSESTLAILRRYEEARRDLATILHVLPPVPHTSISFADRLGAPAVSPTTFYMPESKRPTVATTRPSRTPGLYEVLIDGQPDPKLHLLQTRQYWRPGEPDEPPTWTANRTPWETRDQMNDQFRDAFMKGASRARPT